MTSVATLQPFATARTRRQSRALQGPSCAEGLYARVFEDILEGQFTAGLSEDLLMQTYAAGRSEVRRVVSRLTHQRVIHARPNQRARVTEPDAHQIRAEIGIIEQVSATTTELTLESLRTIIVRERQSLEINRQSTTTRLGMEFHLELARMGGNTPLIHFLEELVPLTGLALMQHTSRTEDWRIREAIVNAMENGNAFAATVQMTAYLDRLATLHWS